jgi:type I restriction enzyme, S subunit
MAALLQRSDRCQHCGVRAVQPPLNQQILDAVGIPLPRIGEQREIVRRIEELFALAERIEERVRSVTVLAERLPSAILARAFRGELVPTEAELAAEEGRDYEPASVLLERIKESRKQTKPAKRERGGNARVSVSHIANVPRRPS